MVRSRAGFESPTGLSALIPVIGFADVRLNRPIRRTWRCTRAIRLERVWRVHLLNCDGGGVRSNFGDA